MTVAWGAAEASVENILRSHPAPSGKCDRAAKAVLVHAKQLDPAARPRRVEPAGREPLIAPKVSLGGEVWAYHVTVEVSAHCVCVLTGPPGTQTADYLDTWFEYPEAHILKP